MRNKELDLIMSSVCDVIGLEYDDVMGKSRKRELVRAREIFVFISYNLDVDLANGMFYIKRWSKSELTRFMERDSHSSTINLLKNIEREIQYSKTIKNTVKEVCEDLGRQDMLSVFNDIIGYDYSGDELQVDNFGITRRSNN